MNLVKSYEENGDIHLVKGYLKNGGDPNIMVNTVDNFSLLIIAVEKSHMCLLQYLFDNY